MSGDKRNISFNKPYIAGKELYYIAQAVTYANLAGDGQFTQRCSRLLEERFGIHRVLLTPSCTAALEMASILCDLGPGDEVIMPSYTFVSTASAVARLGARPVFVDIRPDTLNIDENQIVAAITPRTKAIVAVHYAGIGCEMDRILEIAREADLWVVEDAAQAVNSYSKGKALGSLGDLGCYSFHETKNYICGEGGALCVNNPELVERAEILRDKGTNRQNFLRGQVDKYTWVDLGSSYVPSEISSAFLFGQLEMLDQITARRKEIYLEYHARLKPLEALGLAILPTIPSDAAPNYHMYYVIVASQSIRDGLLQHLRDVGIQAVFHYVPLHSSPFGRRNSYFRGGLTWTETMSARLLRLPFYFELSVDDQTAVVDCITSYLAAGILP